MAWLLVALAWADPAAAPAEPALGEVPAPVALPELPEALGSALDDPTPISLPGDAEGLGEVLSDWASQDRDTWSGSTFVRPAMAVIVAGEAHPTALGFQVGRRWWQLEEGLAGSVTAVAHGDFPLAQAAGSYDLGAAVLGGPWLEIVGLQVGPGLGYSRWRFDAAELGPALGVDARAELVLDLKLVHLVGGVAPRWLVTGDRPAASFVPLGLSDELAVNAGAAVTLGTVRVGLGWARRFTAIDPLDRYALDVRFRLL